jgi:hypothetical protein
MGGRVPGYGLDWISPAIDFRVKEFCRVGAKIGLKTAVFKGLPQRVSAPVTSCQENTT